MEKRETKANLEIAVTAKLLEDEGGDQYESACGLKSKRKIEGGPLKENKRQERITRDIDGDADDATEVSEAPSLFFDLGPVASAQEQESLPQQKTKRQQQQHERKESLMHRQVFFDPTSIIASRLTIEGIDIGASFRLLQEEAASVVNDAQKMLTLDQLPRFLAANHIWDTTYQLPGVWDDDHEVVQATLCVPIVRLSDELVLFCRSLVHNLTSKGYIRSRDTKSRGQDALLVLFQQASQKLPVRFLGFVELKPPREERHQRAYLEDVWALSGFCKDSIDLHLRHSRMLLTTSCVLVFGFQMTLYHLSFQKGIYIWQVVHTTYLPKGRYDSINMIECIELIKSFKDIMDKAETEVYTQTPTRPVENDDELPEVFRPRPTNITPSKRPFFGHIRRSSGSI